MLLSFSVGNFRSFRAEQTLNLLASKRLGTGDNLPHSWRIPNTDERALRVASLYGANGAGKSNLVRALRLVKQLVLEGTPPGKRIRREPFLLDEASLNEPTSFELQFVEDGEVFGYGLCYDAQHIHQEWLTVYKDKKDRSIFNRVTDEDGGVTVTLGQKPKNCVHSSKIRALAEVGARPNQLFLTEVVNLDDEEAQGPSFHRAVRWFASTLEIIGAGASFASLAETLASDVTFAQFAGQFLREAGTGISGLKVETKGPPKSKGVTVSLEEVAELFKAFPGANAVTLPGPGGADLVFDRTTGTVKFRKIMALHDREGEPIGLPFREESDGSQQLLHLLPALHRISAQPGGVFVIDELERSMHPMLARKFIEFFLKVEGNRNSQLVFTTHESTLLDLDLVRRDGIWFAEKDEEGATHLYSLADFKPRKDLRIEKGYLEGRFGAIPFLGGIDHLIEEQAAEAKT